MLQKNKHYTGSSLSLKDKESNNIWDSIDDVISVINKVREGKWLWWKNPRCKYIDVRIDMRDGGCIIMDREGNRIDPNDLQAQ